MRKRIRAAFEITRPVNCLISGVSIFVASIIAGPIQEFSKVGAAILSGMLFTAAANTINDWYDLAIDRINRPNRVLPSRRMHPEAARVLAIFLFVCGIFFSIFINYPAVIIAILSSFLLISYSARLKRTVLWGNLTVSFMTALAFIYGALAAGNWSKGLIPAVFAFLFHFGREVVKDMEDVAGDAAMSARTFPIRFGRKAALSMISAIYLLLLALTPLPYIFEIYGRAYWWTVLIGVNMVVVIAVLILWFRDSPATLRRVSQILKADMLVGLLAIYLGS